MDEELSAEVGGQKLSLKSQSLNTILTILCLIGVVLACYQLLGHAADARDASREFVSAMKDMTRAMRQGNCLNEFPPDRREHNAELCKRLAN